jgi:hypothetical protein
VQNSLFPVLFLYNNTTEAEITVADPQETYKGNWKI